MARNERKGNAGPCTAERQYNFVMNPYPDVRVWTCPFCGAKTGQRKLPLAIHVEPHQMVMLNYTCRYCRACDLLIAQKHDIEGMLAGMFSQADPTLVGNDYLVHGTVEKETYKQNVKDPVPPAQAMASIHPFKVYYKELRMREQGWFPKGVEPPVRQPPEPDAWVKRKGNRHG